VVTTNKSIPPRANPIYPQISISQPTISLGELTPIRCIRTILTPQTLRPRSLTRTRRDDTRHDIIRIKWTGIVPGGARVCYSSIVISAYLVVEADAISAPVVGAAAAYCGQDRSWELCQSGDSEGEKLHVVK
jgi:hypothetical protein